MLGIGALPRFHLISGLLIHMLFTVLPLLHRRDGSAKGAGILGAHVEGPFISPEKKGCHPKQHIRGFGSDPVKAIQKVYGSTENIAIVTIAPELDGSDVAIKWVHPFVIVQEASTS
ncbi:hypothetical protein Y032_0499g2567 [Ancylostoma ceylanicum]|uniref:N-acetylglucosamine-6-phosphate deacetylase n=1 Tax=Ancylostoma ceylanicum TaxID=53326 RepID=A0A016WU91_9BILA|nr:hypothetical protein Y032_0499g2567 [Ancylostoma ceylanicum]